MKETQPQGYRHLEALHYLAGIPFVEHLGVRANKEKILEDLGFSKGTNIALKKEFLLPEPDENLLGIEDYLVQQISQGRFVAMLFKDGRWESMGGAPVTYLMAEKDIRDKLVFSNGKLIEVSAHDGKVLQIDREISLQTYSRRKSIASTVSGFANYEDPITVRLGGGFRLQLDDLVFIDGEPHLLFSGHFSFNDMGSRVLALSCKEDCAVPRYETSFLLKINSGQLSFMGDMEFQRASGSSGSVRTVVNKVVSSLFYHDGKAISELTKMLLSVKPVMGIHQFEGIFSIPSESEISAEIIDFDGLEAFDVGFQGLQIDPSERLIRGQLRRAGFLTTDPESLLQYIAYRRRVAATVGELIKSSEIPDDIKERLSQQFINSFDLFTRNRTDPVKLGRLLDTLCLDWEDTTNPQVKYFRNENDMLIMFSVEGFNLAFWKDSGKLVDCSNLRKIAAKLSRVVGKEILPVHLSALKEGD
jgi:hypothetical protein